MEISQVESILHHLAVVIRSKHTLANLCLQDGDFVTCQNDRIDALAKPVEWVLQENAPAVYVEVMGGKLPQFLA
jgi:hypothetical protein